ncbi:hypothetical protein [Coprobacter sp.]
MKKIRIIDYVLLVWCLFMVVLGIISSYEVDNIPETDIFYLFYTNTGVEVFGIVDLALYMISSAVLLGSVIKKGFSRNSLIILAIVLVLLIVEAWIFLWYTSTFYYGEIRDKQGTWFPWIDLVYIYYLVWLLPLKRMKYNGLQWGLCIGATLLFIGLFELVLEPWHLNWL